MKPYNESLAQHANSSSHAPEKVETVSPLHSVVSTLDRQALQTLLLKLVENHPELVVELQIELFRLKLGSAHVGPDTDPPTDNSPQLISISDVRKKVRSAVLSASRLCDEQYDLDDDGSAVFTEIDETIDPLIEMAQLCIDGADSMRALNILEAITDELISAWDMLSEYEYEYDDQFARLGDAWAEALLSTELSSEDRQMWSAKIDDWLDRGGDCGADSGLEHAGRAATEGWDDPPLVIKLNSDILAVGHAVVAPDASNVRLTRIRLKILERSGRLEDAAKLARVEGIHDWYMELLVTLGLPREAVEYAEAAVTTARSSLDLAKKLHSHDEIELALLVAERGLDFADNMHSLAVWTREAAWSDGRRDLAMRAGLLAVLAKSTLDDFVRLQTISDGSWPEIREEILTHIRDEGRHINDGQVDILFHEGLFLDALKAVTNSYSYSLIERVVVACLTNHPAAVIPICKAQAEDIVNAAKSTRYPHAIKWLTLARDAYSGAGNLIGWIEYKNTLMKTHGRKSSLMPSLRSL